MNDKRPLSLPDELDITHKHEEGKKKAKVPEAKLRIDPEEPSFGREWACSSTRTRQWVVSYVRFSSPHQPTHYLLAMSERRQLNDLL